MTPRAGLPEASRQRSLRAYLTRRPNWSTEILFVFPLFVIYQVGTFGSDQLNGVDFVSTLLFRLRARSEWGLLAFAALVFGGATYLYLRMRRSEKFQLRMMWPMLVESGLYALVMGTVILFVMTKILGLRPPSLSTAPAGSPWMVIYVSAGAGLHEELVFRLVLFGGLLAGLTRWTGLSRFTILLVALLVSSAVFSASHHLPPHGESFTLFAFVYRVLAGAIFGVIYLHRGFSTAVYTHFLYDVLVLGFWRG
jgi:membrane protease YdiL (CAAX protease family)